MRTAATAARARRLSRLSVSVFFFMHGLCFSAWASRIPTGPGSLRHRSNRTGGNTACAAARVLHFTAVLRMDDLTTRKQKGDDLVCHPLYIVSLVTLAICSSVQQLMCCLFLFGFFANALNLSMNTQAVEVEKLYQRRLLSTFHGLWSIAGFAGAAIGAWSIGRSVSPAALLYDRCLVHHRRYLFYSPSRKKCCQ